MAVARASSTQLGCGRDIDEVWDHRDRAPDVHELTCPYCRAARADLEGLARATRQLRDDDARNPDLQPGPGVLERILAVAHAEVRRGRRLPLDQPGPDGTSPSTISEQAVTAVVRRVGDRTAKVQIRRCTITTATPTALNPLTPDVLAPDASGPGRTSSETDDPGPAAVAVSLRVSVSHDLAIAAASAALREAVISAVAQEVGVSVRSVAIDVEDVHDA